MGAIVIPDDDDPIYHLIARKLEARIASDMDSLAGSACTYTTCSTADDEPLTIERIARVMKFATTLAESAGVQLQPYQRDMLDNLYARFDVLRPLAVVRPRGHSIFGMNVIENQLAITRSPARAHKKRRNQTEAYHLRIQKKWNKRFGYVHTPGAYMLGGDTLCVHPTIGAQLRAVAKA